MNGFDASQVVNGTWGEVWFDGEYLAECISCKGTVDMKYEDVNRTRHLIAGKKMVSLEGKIEIKLHKVSSTIMKKISETLKAGKTPSYTVISNVEDPDAIGGERVAYYNCKFDSLTLADWESGKNGEESYSGSFEDWEILDTMN